MKNISERQRAFAVTRMKGHHGGQGETPKVARLRQAREKLGLSRSEFARLLKVPENSVGRWERGECRPQPTLRASVERLLRRLERSAERNMEHKP